MFWFGLFAFILSSMLKLILVLSSLQIDVSDSCHQCVITLLLFFAVVFVLRIIMYSIF